MAARYSNPVPQYSDINGVPFAGGELQFFENGTTTPKDVFSDPAGTISIGNEITLDSQGRVSDFFGEGTYRVRMLDVNSVQIFERDDVIIQSPQSAQLSDFDPATSYSIGDLVQGSDGNFYQSETNGNVGNNPVTDLVNWSQVVFLTEWNPNVTYPVQELVIGSDGFLYRSLINGNVNNDPVASPVQWGPGVRVETTSLNVLPQGYKQNNGLILSNSSGDLAHDIEISVGAARNSTNNTDIKLLVTLTKRIDATFAEGNNAGGFPTAISLLANTWYHFFAIVKADGTVDAGFDTSLTAANLLADATDFTGFRRIGSVLTDGASNILPFLQNADTFTWHTPIVDQSGSLFTTVATSYAVSTPTGLVSEFYGAFNFDPTGGAAHYLYIYSPDLPDVTVGRDLSIIGQNSGGFDGKDKFNFRVFTDATTDIRSQSTNAASFGLDSITGLGWRDLFE